MSYMVIFLTPFPFPTGVLALLVPTATVQHLASYSGSEHSTQVISLYHKAHLLAAPIFSFSTWKKITK